MLYDIDGHTVASPNPAGEGQPDLRELGLPGTLLLSGFVLEEQNPALQGRKGLDTYKAMGYDPTVAMLLKSIELPIRATPWHVDPADDSEQAIALADFAHYNFFEFGDGGGASTFDDTLRQAVTGRNQFGFAAFEQVYRIDDDRYPGKVCIDKFAWRAQTTRYKWNVEEVDTPEGGRMRKLTSMTQWAPPFYQYTTIPADKLAIFVRDQNGENFDGIPLLRAAYKPWWIRDRLYSIQAVGLERSYMGVPVGKLPMSYTANMQKLMQDIVQGLRTHERAGAVMREDMQLDILRTQLEGKAMQDAIDFLTHQITLPALAQFLLLGSGNVGSFALSNDQSDLFLMSLNADCNYTSSVFNMDPVLPRLIDFNFPNVPRTLMPRLSHGDVGQRNMDKVLKGLAAMAQWGIIVPDDGLEDAVREQIGMPERDGTVTPEYLSSLLQQITPAAPPGRQHGLPRPPIPGATNPQAQGPDGQPSPQLVAAAERRHQLDQLVEAQARMPWRRPARGRLTEQDRMKIRATETFMEFMEGMKGSTGKTPERPSIRAAKQRRPYPLRARHTRVSMSEKDFDTLPARVARAHVAAFRDFINAQGKRKPDGHVPLPKDGLTVSLSEADEAAPETPASPD